MSKIVIMDLDGSLALIDHRVHLAHSRAWDEFHAAATWDRPNFPVIELTRAMRLAGYQIVILTGRTAKHRVLTERWLAQHQVPWDMLFMRDDEDHSPDVQFKSGVLSSLRKQGMFPIFAVEDRDRVVKMWRENGLTCLQCAEGLY